MQLEIKAGTAHFTFKLDVGERLLCGSLLKYIMPE